MIVIIIRLLMVNVAHRVIKDRSFHILKLSLLHILLLVVGPVVALYGLHVM